MEDRKGKDRNICCPLTQKKHSGKPYSSCATGIRRPHPVSGLGAVGADTLAAIRAAKRPRPAACPGFPTLSGVLSGTRKDQEACVRTWNDSSEKNGAGNGSENDSENGLPPVVGGVGSPSKGNCCGSGRGIMVVHEDVVLRGVATRRCCGGKTRQVGEVQ